MIPNNPILLESWSALFLTLFCVPRYTFTGHAAYGPGRDVRPTPHVPLVRNDALRQQRLHERLVADDPHMCSVAPGSPGARTHVAASSTGTRCQEPHQGASKSLSLRASRATTALEAGRWLHRNVTKATLSTPGWATRLDQLFVSEIHSSACSLGKQ